MLIRLLPVMAVSLAGTLVLELIFALLWGIRGRHDLFLTAGVNILTNPVVVFFHYWVIIKTGLNAGVITMFLEIAAVLAEGVIYRKYQKNIYRPMFFSLCANAFSYAAGELINGL